MSEYLPIGISITNQCYDCMQMDAMCDPCQDLADARLTDKAHEIVDEGNLIYPHAWLINRAEPSNHDWTERDGEYKEPIVKLQDGGEYEELWELQDETQRARETECPWCHLLTPKQFNDCQDCDRPLERNVR
jgi:hypothetical protein